jgi:uncharacterized membrane protein YkvI
MATRTSGLGRWIRIWILPGAVFEAVIVGGGYGTGREVMEFISRFGAVGGLAALAMIAVLWGIVLAVTFEFARQFKTRDYRSFFKEILGRYWFLYELFFAAALLIVLAVCGAAAGAVLQDSFGLPPLVGIGLMLVFVGVLNYYGRAIVERFLTGWGLLMIAVFAGFVVLTLVDRGDAIVATFELGEVRPGWALSAFQFFLYNIGAGPVILYATGHLETRRQAIGAGFIAGLLGVLPGLALHIAFMSAYPAIIQEPLPVYWILQQLGFGWLLVIYVVVLFVTIAKTGVGMLQGLNERLDAWWRERKGAPLGARTHSTIALAAVLGSLLLANIGIVTLVAKGYGGLAWFAFAVYVLPVLTIGVAKLRRAPAPH